MRKSFYLIKIKIRFFNNKHHLNQEKDLITIFLVSMVSIYLFMYKFKNMNR
jgi:hypothetical protein